MKYCGIEDIYKIFQEIKLDDEFIHRLDRRRSQKYVAEKNLLEGDAVYIDINNILNMPDGKIYSEIGNAHFEYFFHKGTRKKLYVILDGARTSSGGKKRDIPFYNRWSWYSFSDCCWLSIEDPMYYLYPGLTVGWFYGTEEENFREYTAQLILAIADCVGIEKENIVVYGSSAGGTAAIHVAALLGCTAVSINGQINFEYSHKDISQFTLNTEIDLHVEDKYLRNNICSLIRNNTVAKYVIVENCRSKWDYNDHFLYFCNKMGINPAFGIDKYNNVITWIYEAYGKKPHTSFEDRNLFFAIDYLTDLVICEENIDRYKPLYQLFGEFWFEKYQIESENEALISKMNSQNSILEVNTDLLKIENFDRIITINNIDIKAGSDKYCHYAYKELISNSLICIDIDGVNIQPFSENLTIGLYDSKQHVMYLKKHTRNLQKIKFAFLLKNSSENLELCIFAGEHGKTRFHELKIEHFTVYRHELNN